MSKTTAPTPCWVVRDASGQSWDDEFDEHHDSQEKAEAGARAVMEEMEDEQTPEEFAAMIGKDHGPEAAAKALSVQRAHFVRAESLHPVQLASPCYTITCDGDDEEGPEGEYGGTIHFDAESPFVALDYDWKEVAGLHFCEECRMVMVCSECDGLAGEGSQDRDGMCPTCWAKDLAAPEVPS